MFFSKKKQAQRYERFKQEFLSKNQETLGKGDWAALLASWTLTKNPKDIEKARSLVKDLIKKNPTSQNYVLLGLTEEAASNLESVIKAASMAFEKNPDEPELKKWLKGNDNLLHEVFDIAQKNGTNNPEYAEKLWDLYIKFSTRKDMLSSGYLMRGVLKGMRGNDKEAILGARKALEFDPNNAEARLILEYFEKSKK